MRTHHCYIPLELPDHMFSKIHGNEAYIFLTQALTRNSRLLPEKCHNLYNTGHEDLSFWTHNLVTWHCKCACLLTIIFAASESEFSRLGLCLCTHAYVCSLSTVWAVSFWHDTHVLGFTTHVLT